MTWVVHVAHYWSDNNNIQTSSCCSFNNFSWKVTDTQGNTSKDKPNDKDSCSFSFGKEERTKKRHIECSDYLQFSKALAVKLWILCSAGFPNSLFDSVLDQQMVAEIELKAFNQVGQGHFVYRNPAHWICGLMSVKLKGMHSGVKSPEEFALTPLRWSVKLSEERCGRLNSHCVMLWQSKQFHVIMTLRMLAIMNEIL